MRERKNRKTVQKLHQEAEEPAEYLFYGFSDNDAKGDPFTSLTPKKTSKLKKVFAFAGICAAAAALSAGIFLLPQNNLNSSKADKTLPGEKFYTEYDYDSSGNKSHSYEYDQEGNMIRHKSLAMTGGVMDTFEYDDSGLVKRMTRRSADGRILVTLEYQPSITYTKASNYIREELILANCTETCYNDFDAQNIAYRTEHSLDEHSVKKEKTYYPEPQECYSLSGSLIPDVCCIEQDFPAETQDSTRPCSTIYSNSSGELLIWQENEYNEQMELVRQTEYDAAGNIQMYLVYDTGTAFLYDSIGNLLSQEPQAE